MKFLVRIEALGEVRDADGNLIETIPVSFEHEVSEEELYGED